MEKFPSGEIREGFARRVRDVQQQCVIYLFLWVRTISLSYRDEYLPFWVAVVFCKTHNIVFLSFLEAYKDKFPL
jgi:hypothetical protein